MLTNFAFGPEFWKSSLLMPYSRGTWEPLPENRRKKSRAPRACTSSSARIFAKNVIVLGWESESLVSMYLAVRRNLPSASTIRLGRSSVPLVRHALCEHLLHGTLLLGSGDVWVPNIQQQHHPRLVAPVPHLHTPKHTKRSIALGHRLVVSSACYFIKSIVKW